MRLPISTTTNRELLNSQTLYNNIICIAVSGGMMICGDANYMCQVEKIHFAQKILGKRLVIVYAYEWLQAAQHVCSNVTLIWIH